MPKRKNTDPGCYQYKLQSGATRWGAVYYVTSDWKTGKPRQKRKQGFLTKADALRWRVAQLDARNRGSLQEPSRQPLGEYLSEWLDGMIDLTPGTRRTYGNLLKWVSDAIGDTPLASVTPALIERAYRDRLKSEDGSATGVHFTHRILKQALRQAVLRDQLLRNPCDRVRSVKAPKHQPTTWTRDQMKAFLAHPEGGGHPQWGDLWHLLAETWLRVGEAMDLRWSDIDERALTISITHAMAMDESGRLISRPPKTPSSIRTLQVNARLIHRLLDRRGEQEASSHIFTMPNGQPLYGVAVWRALKAACKIVGVPEITTHELRHSGGSIAYMGNVDVMVISERMGHANVNITRDVYLHLKPDHHRAAADLIAELISDQYDSSVISDEPDS